MSHDKFQKRVFPGLSQIDRRHPGGKNRQIVPDFLAIFVPWRPLCFKRSRERSWLDFLPDSLFKATVYHKKSWFCTGPDHIDTGFSWPRPYSGSTHVCSKYCPSSTTVPQACHTSLRKIWGFCRKCYMKYQFRQFDWNGRNSKQTEKSKQAEKSSQGERSQSRQGEK